MSFEDAIIDGSESLELKSGEIERVEDTGVSTYADLEAFLHEQAGQTRDLLQRQADEFGQDLDAEEVARVLDETLALVDESIELAFAELTVASVRVSCSQLSDIVGFEMQIDETGLDQFGLEKRSSLRSTMHGIGFRDYAGERAETGDVAHGSFEMAARREQMGDLDTPMEDVDAVMDDMRPYGEVEYVSFAESGPVLIVLPEMHYDAGILQQNLDVMLAIQDRIAMLATEGIEGEVTEDMVGDLGKGSREHHEAEIADYETSMSSMVVEDVLGEDIHTLGVEDLGNLLYTLAAVQRSMAEAIGGIQDNPELLASMQKLEGEIMSGDMTKADLLEYQGEMAALLTEGFNEMLLYYRNQIWLNAVQTELLENQDALSGDNNMVVLVCGGAHAEDLTAQAEHYGFKGVVRFMPDSFNDPLDMRAMEAYASKQMGGSFDDNTEEAHEYRELADEETEELKQYWSRLEIVLTQSAYSADFQRYAYSYLKKRVPTDRLDNWIADSPNPPNMTLLSMLTEVVGKEGFGEGDVKTELEETLSLIFSELKNDPDVQADQNLDALIAMIEEQSGLDLQVS